MRCLSPIFIRNNRYSRLTKSEFFAALKEHPSDVARMRFFVPCGKCAACRRRIRNDWFVRMNREKAYANFMGIKSYFLTITVNPRSYAMALDSPAAFIRSFFESYRHATGKKLKHIVFQEFGATGRLHFHGLVFASDLHYSELRQAVEHLGFIWIRESRSADAGYVSKYVTKGLESSDIRYKDPRYRRKFVSSHFGDYLGSFPPPSSTTRIWSFTDVNSGTTFHYAIPRYYQKYTSAIEKRRLEFQSAVYLYSMSPFPAVLDVLREEQATIYPDSAPDYLAPSRLRQLVERGSIRLQLEAPPPPRPLCTIECDYENFPVS